MNNATKLFDDVIENEISNSNLGYAIIDQLQKTKKGERYFITSFRVT